MTLWRRMTEQNPNLSKKRYICVCALMLHIDTHTQTLSLIYTHTHSHTTSDCQVCWGYTNSLHSYILQDHHQNDKMVEREKEDYKLRDCEHGRRETNKVEFLKDKESAAAVMKK